MAELLVVGVTWWYTYQSYRIQKSLKIGSTLGSLLLYYGKLSHGPSGRCPDLELTRYYQEVSISCAFSFLQ